MISPRNRNRAESLATRYASVAIAEHNQQVIDRSSTILVCLRPDIAAPALRELVFAEEHAVISVMAGVALADLRGLVAPARVLARAIPLPAVARRHGLTALYPADVRTDRLFAELGTTSVAANEDALDALSTTTATIATHFAYLGAISRWLTRHGVAEHEAARYVLALYQGIAATLDPAQTDLVALSEEYATPGGINQQFLASLASTGFLDDVDRSLDGVFDRLDGHRLGNSANTRRVPLRRKSS